MAKDELPPSDLMDNPVGDDFADVIRDKGERSAPDAVSPKGAKGVMQVMPDTARDPGFGVRPAQDDSPEEMERVGRDYSGALLSHYKFPSLAAAAYNAGPGTVDNWLKEYGDPREGKISEADFVDNIPFDETKDYVKRVAAQFNPTQSSDKIGQLAQAAVPEAQTPTVARGTPQLLSAQSGPPADLITPPPDLVDPQSGPPPDLSPETQSQAKQIPPAGVMDMLDPMHLLGRIPGVQQAKNYLTSKTPGMPGPMQAAVNGGIRAYEQAGQFSPAVGGKAPADLPKEGPESRSLLSLENLKHPGDIPSELAYHFAEGSPEMAGATIGGAIGSRGGPWGAAGGAAIGGGLMRATMTIGNSFATEIKKTPNDPEGAYNRAWAFTGIDAAGSAAGWALFGLNPFKNEIKNLLFQALGVQPTIAGATRAVENVEQGRPAGEGVPETMAEAAVTQTPLMLAGRMIGKAMRQTEPKAAPSREDAAGAFSSAASDAYSEVPQITDQRGAAEAGTAAAPPPNPQAPAPNTVIGLKMPNGAPRRASVVGAFENGKYTTVRFEDGTHRDYRTEDLLRDKTEPPPRADDLTAPPAYAEPVSEGERFDIEPPYRGATGRPPRQAALNAEAIKALDQAAQMEQTALNPKLNLSDPDRQSLLTQAARIRQKYAAPSDAAGISEDQAAASAERSRTAQLGPLGRAANEAPDRYSGEYRRAPEPEGFDFALADVKAVRSVIPREQSLFGLVRDLGGVKLQGPDGFLTKEGQDLAHVLKDVRYPGLVNNRAGMAPDQLRGYLQEHGWFGMRPEDGADMQALYDIMDREGRGQKVYHPESNIGLELENRTDLERQMDQADINLRDSHVIAARKLAQWRNQQLERRAARAAGTAKNPIAIETPADLGNVERHADLEPSDAQKESGIYKKGHGTFQGMPVVIETPKGAVRQGKRDENGVPAWENISPAAYGSIPGTTGADSKPGKREGLDIYIGDHPESPDAFVVDQIDPKTKRFDEHKIIAGVRDEAEAKAIYDAGFSDHSGPSRRGAITAMSVDRVKEWAFSGKTKKPIAYIEPIEPEPEREKPSGGTEAIARADAVERAKKLGVPVFPTMTSEDILANVHEREAIMAVEADADATRAEIEGDIDDAIARDLPEATDELPWSDEVSGQGPPQPAAAVEPVESGDGSKAVPEEETGGASTRQEPAGGAQLGAEGVTGTSEGTRPVEVPAVQVRENEARNGVEIIFKERPADDVLGKLKGAGFRWSKPQRLWYAKRTPQTLALAKSLSNDRENSSGVESKSKDHQRAETSEHPTIPERAEPAPKPGQVAAPLHGPASAFKVGDLVTWKVVDRGRHFVLVGHVVQRLPDFLRVRLTDVPPNTLFQVGALIGARGPFDLVKAAEPIEPTVEGSTPTEKADDQAAIDGAHAEVDAGEYQPGAIPPPSTEPEPPPGPWRIGDIVDLKPEYGNRMRGAGRAIIAINQDSGQITLDGGLIAEPYMIVPSRTILSQPPQAPKLSTEAPDELQGNLSSSAPGQGPASVPGTGQNAPDRPIRPGEGHGGTSAPRPTPRPGPQGSGRPAEGSAGPAPSGGESAPADARPSRPGTRPVEGAAGGPADAEVQGENFTLEPGAVEEGRGPKQKALDNIAAIELVKRLKSEDRPATRAEQAVLAKYVGWGGLSGAFRNNQQKFSTGLEEVGKRLEDILTPEEHATARRSTQYAHYTAEHVIRSMWSAVRKMGFEGGSVFEPGMGIGHFFGMMPPDVAARSQYQGIEMDALTADIAKLLYPQSGVREADFTQTPIPDNTFDLVIGNPPFSDTVIKADPKYAPRNFMLHDYFFAKSIDALRPGGLLAFVTSAGTMNKIDAGARHYLAQRAEFLGGVRLPSTAFKKNAGTEVTADILFFKKRDEPISKMDAAGETWTATQTRDLPTPEGGTGKAAVSTYFTKHPEQVLGREGLFDKLYKGRYAVHAPEGADLEAELDKALDRLPKDVYTALASPEGKAELDLLSTERKDGSFYVQDGKLMQYSGGAGRPVPMRGAGVEGGLTGPDRERVTRLIPVRDALRDVFAADLAEDGPAAASAREKLNTAYDGFVRKFGPINKADYQYRRPTIIQQESARAEEREAAIDRGESWVEGDFNATSMYDEGKSITEIAKARNAARERARAEGKPFNEGSFAPEEMPDVVLERLTNIAPFMDDPESYRLRAIEQYDSDTGKATKKRVFFESVLTRETEPDIRSAQDGVLWSLNKFGRLDIDKIAEKRGQNSEAVVAELGDSVFLVPGTHSTYAMADEYLSGDVVDKLLTAKNHAQRDKQFQRNVQALEAAIPPPLPPSQITMNLGMPWIPVPSLTAFVRDHLELGAVRIKRSKALGGWSVTVATQGNGFPRWGTAHLTATRIVTEALNKTKPRVYTRDAATEPGKTAFDAVATQAAADKIDAVSAEFQNWLGQDPQRKDDLANAYNDILNRTALRQFDGAYLTTPGISAEWRWRPHQRRVVARIILTGNTYVAHAVGAGKTSEYIGAGMEMRRLGLINKPMYAVPNHMLGQFTKEFYEQYPLAQIMVADERRFHTSRRKQFMANVAQSDIDAVIITHSSFGKIPLSYESQKKIVDEQVAELREALSDLDKQSDRITIKKIESQIEKLEQRLTGAFTSRKDKTNTFEEMGIDFLFVDEAHEFRKLDFASRQNIKGITTEGSQRAFDLYSKIRHLETKRPGRSVVMGSGTPITNTMGELFTLQRYMQLPALQRHGLAHFDSWASAFGETKTETEPTPQGTYERVTRFSAFVNAYELYKMVGEVMDIVTPGQLDQYVVRPKLKGGKRELHLAEKTPAYEEFQRDLVRRVNEIKARKRPPEPGDDILLSVINDGRHAAIDMRYVGEHQNDPKSKLNQMIDAAFGIWQRTKDVKFFDPGSNYQKEIARGPATQMIFSNLGVNGRGPMDFGGYEWIKRELVRRGVPKNEIAFIKDYKTHVAKQRLFNDMNAGRIRFLVGSTQKMGTGVNAQRRLYATHNLDPLWFPADDEQRVGRILRQGNLNPEIQVHDYATEGTYDEQMWKMMGRKGRFVEQFFRGDPTLRRMEDIGEAGYYEQASAMAASDPRIIRLTEMNHELQKLERQWAAHDSEQYSMGQKIRYARGEIEYADGKIPQIQADIAQHVPTHGDAFSMIVGDKQFSKRADAEEQFGKDLNAKVETMVKGERQILGELGGFAIAVESYGKDGFGYLWRRTNKKWQELGTSAKTPGGIIRAFEKDFDGLADNVRYLEDDKRRANQTIDSLSPQVGKEFAKKADIARLRVEVGELERAIQPVKPLATVQDVDTALRDAEGALRVGSMSREGYDKRRNELLAKRAELETKPPAAPAASPDQTPPAKTPKASYAIRREPAPLPAGATIEDMSVQDAHRGEMFGSKRVLDPQGHVAAVADLSVLPGEVWIKHVKSHAPRQGYATALIDDLFREFPGERIRVSGMTDDGAKFFRSAFNVDKKGYLTQKEGAPRYALSDTPSPPFYSALTRAVEGVKQDKAHPAQWSGIIDNLPGMKKDEVEWSGIKDWLAQQKGAVSKADVADYLRANQIQIKEVLKTGARDTEKLFPEEIDDWDHIPMSGKEYSDGQPKESSFKHGDAVVTWHWANNGDIQRVSARYGDVDLGDFNDFIEAREVLIRRADMGEEGGATKFGSYTLPGGENYRELLLTLPENKSTIDVRQTSDGAWRLWDSAKNDWMRTEDGKLVPMFHSESQARHVADEYGIGHGNALRDANDAIRAYTEEHPDAVPARDAELARLTAASNAIANERQRNRGAIHGRNFRSGHFDEPNIIAHVRFNERTAERALYSGPHAKATTEDRVLFIEEIQSDWHQQGRRRGYVKPMTPTQEARRRELVDKASSSGRFDLKKLTEDERREYERLGQQAAAASNGVPDAPFKTTWPELAFKRMLRYASENGYDQIAWTTGDQQADRYDLSKHISHLQLEDNASGGIGHANLEGEFSGGQLEAWDHNNKRVIDQWVQDEQQLIELIGKDAADKLLGAAPGRGRKAGLGVRVRSLQGLDLKVGGEGMRGFYDKMLPAFANKYGKKWGAKVGETTIDATRYPGVPMEEEDGTPSAGKATAVHSMDITPAMRESVMGGQPLFQRIQTAGKFLLGSHVALTKIVDLNDGSRLVYSPKFEKGRQKLAEQLEAELKRRNLGDIGVHVADAVLARGDYQHADGMYLAGVITIALDAKDPMSTLDHEILHAVRDLGLYTPDEWSLLEEHAKKHWVPRYRGVLAHYDDQADLIDEAIAYAGQDYAHGKAGDMPPKIRSLLQRLIDFFKTIRDFFGKRGFKDSDDVFARVMSGEIGARARSGAPQAQGSSFAHRKKADALKVADELQQREGRVYSVRGTKDEHGKPYWTVGTDGQKIDADTPLPSALDHHLRNLRTLDPNAPEHPFVDTHENQPGYRAPAARRGPAAPGQGALPLGPGKKGSYAIRQPSPDEPKPAAEGKDYVDQTAEDLADHIRGAPPGTYERALDRLTPTIGAYRYQDPDWIRQNIVGPRTFAELDTLSAKMWEAWKEKTREYQTRLTGLRGEIAPTFLKLDQLGREHVYSVEELRRLTDAGPLVDDGRALVMRNTDTMDATKSKPGETLELSADETKALLERQEMFRHAWTDIMEASARRLGWTGDWGESIDTNLRFIEQARDMARSGAERRHMERVLDVLTAMERQRQQAYVPFMRFGDYYLSVTRKPGVGEDREEGFPRTESFQLAERPPMREFLGGKIVEGVPPDYAKKMIADAQVKFPPDKFRIEHGWLHRKPNILRDLDIPAIEKLFTLMEGGVLDRLKEEESLDGRAEKKAARLAAKSRYDKLYGDMVDALHDQLYQELKAGFKKRARNVPGWGSDFDRVTGSYMNWTARHVAENLHHDNIERAYTEIQDKHPSPPMRLYWRDWKAAQERPSSPVSTIANSVNQVGFMYALAFNPSSTFLVALHGPLFAIPTMSKGIGIGAAAVEFGHAYREGLPAMRWDERTGLALDHSAIGRTPEEKAFVQKMLEEGDLHAKGADDIRSLGEHAASLWGHSAPQMRRIMDMASSNIAVADQLNRVAVALGTYRLVRRPGVLKKMDAAWQDNELWRTMAQREGITPENAARFMLGQATGEWGKESRSAWGRTDVGRLFTSLHGFIIKLISNMWKLVRTSLGGRRAFMWTMAALWAGAGIEGLPFVQDVENLLDEIWKTLTGRGNPAEGHDPMLTYRLRALVMDTGLGPLGAEMVMKGPASTLSGIDIASRIGVGDIASRVIGDDIMLTVPAILGNILYGTFINKDYTTALPAGLRNPARAVKMVQHGATSQSGKSVYIPKNKVTPLEAGARALGFQSTQERRARELQDYSFRAKRARGTVPRLPLVNPYKAP